MNSQPGNAYLVGGGIASLAAAVLLIRDAGFNGCNIEIFECLDVPGGSLDGAGNAEDGYVIRGGRMFEEHFACTFDLLDSIPTLDNPNLSVAQEIILFTRQLVTSSNCRLVDDGVRVEAPEFQLSVRDKWDLLRLSLTSELSLGQMTIAEYFSPQFLRKNFWIMWCTMFAFQSWHSVAEFRRYMRRFLHLLPGFNRLEGIQRTRLNQYDSIVRPVVAWLENHGVTFHLRSTVTTVEFDSACGLVTQLRSQCGAEEQVVEIFPGDKVFLTLGSMTDCSTLGSMSSPPERQSSGTEGGSWALWNQISAASCEFGRPEVFAGDPDKTLWESFTVTLRDPGFFEFMESFTGNVAGTGGLVTFKNSGWLLSVVLSHQPHFSNQGEDEWIFWGYALHPQRVGSAVGKSMLECTGEEILMELAHHLGISEQTDEMFATANCIPCLMPYITAQFMPRSAGARPAVVPAGSNNFAFVGQFCELPDDTVFTVEYSVRSAQAAVYELTSVDRPVTSLYRGFAKPGVMLAALRTLLMDGRG